MALRFDQAIISSSPLMLLQALYHARAGHTVCVIDRDPSLGGVWQVHHMADGRRAETACHLIEAFPGVYAYLAQQSGVPFKRLETQPLRLPRRGGRLFYSSRLTVLAAVAMAAARLAGIGLRRIRRAPSREEQFVAQEARLRLLDFTRYLLPGLVTGYSVKAPVTGFADFIEALLRKCRAEGVVFVTANVTRITGEDGMEGWQIETTDPATAVHAGTVHCAASATLEQTGPRCFEAYDAPSMGFRNVLVTVSREALKHSVSYALFPQDPHVMRLSRIDQPQGEDPDVIFLLQFWQDIARRDADMRQIIGDKLTRAGIIAASHQFTLLESINGQFTPYDRTRQLPEGEVAPGLFVWSSAGNLASGVANWRKGRYRFRIGRFARPIRSLQ